VQQQPVISEQDKAQLKRALRKELKAEVTVRLFSQSAYGGLHIPGRHCPYCPQTQRLLEELVGLSPKLHLEVIDFYEQPQLAREHRVTRIPAIELSKDSSAGVKFYGIPSGYELATIIEGIKTISRGVSPLSMDARKKLRQVNQPVHIQVFVTPT
jgi:thiol-disulfide isomerase/thioredoxin